MIVLHSTAIQKFLILISFASSHTHTHSHTHTGSQVQIPCHPNSICCLSHSHSAIYTTAAAGKIPHQLTITLLVKSNFVHTQRQRKTGRQSFLNTSFSFISLQLHQGNKQTRGEFCFASQFSSTLAGCCFCFSLIFYDP